ncbi:MAG: VanZ family protein [Deltaproteobacteria bacterium]|nr:VanZ family protein [Deltaproteobacteria bacterium]
MRIIESIERKNASFSYACFIVCSLFIFLTIPFARTFQASVDRHLGDNFLLYFVLAAVICSFFVVLARLKQSLTGKVFLNRFAWLSAIAGTYVYLTVKLRENPEEAIHFLEYGLLSYFAHRALSHHVKDVTVYFTASLATLFVGTVDEILQWTWPGRYWDIRDVGLNFLSGVLFQLGLYKGINPQMVSEKIKKGSIKIFSIVLCSCIILLGLCASNTPSRIVYYSKRLPWLSFLHSNAFMMTDYGYKHRDPEIGIFYSRFSKEKLQSIDDRQKEIHSNILNKTTQMDYEQFLRTYNPYSHPFLYEMRIHLFRRDRYLLRGKNPNEAKRQALTISFKENLILEKYFGNTLRLSVYRWPQQIREEVRKHAALDAFYESPVGSDLFTSFTEKTLWSAIGGFLIAVVLANLLVFKRSRR